MADEPSMEEILSSIKRIIAEDSEAALSGPRTRRAVAAPVADPVPVASEPEVLELTDPVAIETPPPVMPEVTPPPVATPAPAPTPAPLVSPSTVEASRSALASLSSLVVRPEVHGSDTIEGLVRELLRPMLTQWLDANLPAIVERQVATEVRRIAERG